MLISSREIDEIIEKKRRPECWTQNIVAQKRERAKKRERNQRRLHNEGVWLWLAREWHELANRVEVHGPYAERSPDEGEADPGAKSRGS